MLYGRTGQTKLKCWNFNSYFNALKMNHYIIVHSRVHNRPTNYSIDIFGLSSQADDKFLFQWRLHETS